MDKYNLTVDDVAALLKVSPRTVRKYIHSGQIKAIVLGGRYRISLTAIADFKKKHASKTKEELYE
ncbi:MAG: helix-turn-helix domain-containing protein [Candidatus Parvarchaeota archaeon]|nr:helix-turn-helix domain-containing protein [Candidatus Jingweiarchaeum tengchongense]